MDVKTDNHSDIVIMRLEGFLDFETAPLFERNYLFDLHSEKVIFDFTKLEFVGSCGLISFMQILSKFCQYYRPRPRFVGVSPEFLRLMETNGFDFTDFYESLNLAIQSYHYGFIPQKRVGSPFF